MHALPRLRIGDQEDGGLTASDATYHMGEREVVRSIRVKPVSEQLANC